MIHKVLHFGSGNTNPADYLFNCRGRAKPPKLLFGDSFLTWRVIQDCQHKQKYTSLVLSFEALISDETTREIIHDYERFVYAGIAPDDVSRYWVLHTDKGRTEAHCIVANVILSTGKRWAHYYDKTDRILFESWQEMTNLKHGFASPKDPDRKRLISVPGRNLSSENQSIYEQVDSFICRLITEGAVRNRDEIISALHQRGYEVKPSINFIGIRPKQTTGKYIRLKGTKYESGFTIGDSEPIRQAESTASGDVRKRIEEYDRLFRSALEKRERYIRKRHKGARTVAYNTDSTASRPDTHPIGVCDYADSRALRSAENQAAAGVRGDDPKDRSNGKKSLEKDVDRSDCGNLLDGADFVVLHPLSKNEPNRGFDAEKGNADSDRWGILSTLPEQLWQCRFQRRGNPRVFTEIPQSKSNTTQLDCKDGTHNNTETGAIRARYGGATLDLPGSIRRNRKSTGRIGKIASRLSGLLESFFEFMEVRSRLRTHKNRIQLFQSKAVRSNSVVRSQRSRWLQRAQAPLPDDTRGVETVQDHRRNLPKNTINNIWNQDIGFAKELQRKPRVERKRFKITR
mgnify:CR=1 FL=1